MDAVACLQEGVFDAKQIQEARSWSNPELIEWAENFRVQFAEQHSASPLTCDEATAIVLSADSDSLPVVAVANGEEANH